MAQRFAFDTLSEADLVVDATYEGGRKGNASDDPIAKLIPGVGNQGGFRAIGNRGKPRLVVLYSSMDDPDWPDLLDLYTGVFTYYGDNKKPGLGLHDTPRGGNRILQLCFGATDDEMGLRSRVPPFLVFTRVGERRDVMFRGLAVPGVEGTSPDDLVAVWRSNRGQRFQNYLAKFTILSVGKIQRAWIDALRRDESPRALAPAAWLKWLDKGIYEPLTSVPILQYRTREEQLPSSSRDRALIKVVYDFFRRQPHGFEHCAARLAHMMDQNMSIDVVTRPSVDGGRDAIGKYRIGPIADRIPITFALEAKCYAETNAVGVKELSRLISRIRHRDFGVLVTTSYLGRQAYEELRQDQHPVIVVSAADIARIFVAAGMGTPEMVESWLTSEFS